MDRTAAEGSWALLLRYADEHSSEDSESESKDEFEDDVEESEGGGGGVGSTIESAGGGE